MPVLILELKDPFTILRIAARGKLMIRLGSGDGWAIVGRCPLPTLHAVSALGTLLSFYCVDTTGLANRSSSHQGKRLRPR
jgi:hypothetical protein